MNNFLWHDLLRISLRFYTFSIARKIHQFVGTSHCMSIVRGGIS